MANGNAVKTDDFRSSFMDKLLMGMSWPEYIRSLMTPFNVVAFLILCIGLPLIVMRFIFGLYTVVHSSNEYPWGLFLSWGLFGGSLFRQQDLSWPLLTIFSGSKATILLCVLPF